MDTGSEAVTAVCFHPYHPVICLADNRGMVKVINYYDSTTANAFHVSGAGGGAWTGAAAGGGGGGGKAAAAAAAAAAAGGPFLPTHVSQAASHLCLTPVPHTCASHLCLTPDPVLCN